MGLVALIIGFLFVLILSVSYLVDPFSLRKDHQVSLAREVINRPENVALWDFFETQKIETSYLEEAQVIILGDSRARLLTDHFQNHRKGDFQGKKVYNLCVGGCSLSECFSIYEWEKVRGEGFPAMETVIMVASLMRFCEPERPNRVEQSGLLVDSPTRYYLNDLVVRRAFTSLIRFKTKNETAPLGGDDRAVMRTWMESYMGFNADTYRSRLESLAAFARELQKREIRLILYSPPGAGGRREAIESAGLVDVKKDFVASLAGMGEFYDLADETEISGVKFKYLPGDPIHHDQGDRVLEFLLSSSR